MYTTTTVRDLTDKAFDFCQALHNCIMLSLLHAWGKWVLVLSGFAISTF